AINHPSLANPEALGRPAQTWREGLRRLLDFDRFGRGSDTAVDRAAIRQTYNLLNTAIWMMFENPAHAGGSLSLVVAEDAKSLREAVQGMARGWRDLADVRGDVLIWGKASGDDAGRSFWSASLKPRTYHVGSVPWWRALVFLAIENPIFLLGVLLAMFVVMAWVTRWLLVRHRCATHPDIAP
ncbi:MAG: hypothetical protein R8K47_08485, partial [Mariprofundaceae bacterium]